jgi:hypothetical protein
MGSGRLGAWGNLGLFERWVVVLWVAGLVGIGVRMLLMPPGARTLWPVYELAGRNWAAGADLYPRQPQGPGYPLFRYSPSVALLLAPPAALPGKWGDLCWRLLNAAALLGGLFALARAIVPATLTRRQTAALLALMLPAGIGHLSNGQCNALVIGLVLLAFAAAAARRWNLAAAALAVASLFKLYPVAAGLLLALLYPRRFGPRFLAALILGAALPFAFADPDYVLRQYDLWFRYALTEDRSGWVLDGTNVDFHLLYRVWLGPMSLTTYRAAEVAAGVAFAGLCLAARRSGRPERRRLTLALGLACVWMTVLGPATESPTYLLLAPCVAWGVLAGWAEPARPVVRLLMLASYALFLSVQVAGLSGTLFYAYRTLGPQPLAGLLYLVALLWHEWTWRPAAPALAPAVTAERASPQAA